MSSELLVKITSLECLKTILKEQLDLFNDDIHKTIVTRNILNSNSKIINYYICENILPTTYIIKQLFINNNPIQEVDISSATDDMFMLLPDHPDLGFFKTTSITGPNMIIKMFHSTDQVLEILKTIPNIKDIIEQHFDKIISNICDFKIFNFILELGFKLPEYILYSPYLYSNDVVIQLLKLYKDAEKYFIVTGDNIYEKCIFIAINMKLFNVVSKCLKEIYNLDILNRAFVSYANCDSHDIAIEFLISGADITYNDYAYIRTLIKNKNIDDVLDILPYVGDTIKDLFKLT